MRIIDEREFSAEIHCALVDLASSEDIGSVMGPGRSGAVAAVYASHILGVPFIPQGASAPVKLGRLLLIDTASESGATLRKIARKYEYANPITLAIYDEKVPEVGRVAFWYEAPKPQRYRHEADRAGRRQLQREHGLRNLP